MLILSLPLLSGTIYDHGDSTFSEKQDSEIEISKVYFIISLGLTVASVIYVLIKRFFDVKQAIQNEKIEKSLELDSVTKLS